LNYSKEMKEFIEKITPPKARETKEALILENIIKPEFERWAAGLSKQTAKTLFDEYRSRQRPGQEGEDESRMLWSIFQEKVVRGEIEEVEEFDDDYPMYFDTPERLIEEFAVLEENSLFLVEMRQAQEKNYNDEVQRFEKLKLERTEKELHAKAQIVRLKTTLANLHQKVALLGEKSLERKKDSETEKFEVLENKILQILREFEGLMNQTEIGIISKAEAKSKENLLRYLTAIEKLLITQITVLKTEVQDTELIRKRKNELEAESRRNAQGSEMTALEKEKKEQEERNKLKNMKKRRVGRKDMFKYEMDDGEKDDDGNNNDEDLEEYKRYFTFDNQYKK
jgi:hypothetical protein